MKIEFLGNKLHKTEFESIQNNDKFRYRFRIKYNIDQQTNIEVYENDDGYSILFKLNSEIYNWLKENTTDYYYVSLNKNPNHVTIYLFSKDDSIKFKLMWGNDDIS